MIAYYNEVDPYAAAWLENLIRAGHISFGIVDTRSIEDVYPEDLREFDRCHFFAGIGGWEEAINLSRWPEDRPVWTGSCPCQPFSAAGKGRGFADERHLWPAWHHLIRECAPPDVFGEQVASADGLMWFDLVSTDLEAENYRLGSADLCAASVGAPQERQRLFFTAISNTPSDRRSPKRQRPPPRYTDGIYQLRTGPHPAWQSELPPLRMDHGLPPNLGRLRAYGNAIVPQVAAGFIDAVLQCEP